MCVLGPPHATCLHWRVPGYRNIPTTKHLCHVVDLSVLTLGYPRYLI